MKSMDPYRLTKAGAIRMVLIAVVLLSGFFWFLRRNGTESSDFIGLFIASVVGVIFIVLFMVIMVLFVRRNYYATQTENQSAEDSKNNLLNVSSNRLGALQKFGIVVFRWLAIPSAALVFLMVCDFAMSATNVEKVVVLAKKQTRNGRDLRVQTLGSKDWYDAEANKPLFRAVENGDTLVIKKSKFFGDWKDVDVIRDGHTIQTLHSISDRALTLVGFFS